MNTGRPRVLLIEDDASLQRFVGLALEDLGIELLALPTVDEGLAELVRAPVDLILTDLMLPGRSGFELIDSLAANPALQGAARLVVFSAGLNPQVRLRLERPEVWRLLSKPCSLVDLQGCVSDALSLGGEQAAAIVVKADPATARAIAEHFGGNEPLYRSFRASCLQQFGADLIEGDRALASCDAQALRRLAHSLKSVLLTLGHTQPAILARALEDSSHAADWAVATPQWHELREQLRALR
ncbi:response regulator [Paucibacter sp. PLA-PC-4]|uniref:hybrid sensor histidine kinase/response regulator n=1 Tax=Paucibacter sp. PLA-PC-4 TaxID=2993655 RepID=UPI002248B8C6|nr:hybrid sensor histidine kinase/response regulator [Paucibacter sp. PLA-PC-4]MCX2860465.1 response regulator [Paucibacter sp. PLA-PC-4]